MEFAELAQLVESLLDRLADRLPEDELKQCRTDAWAGEWDVLLNSLAATLLKKRIPVDSAERDDLAAVLNHFALPRPDDHFINNRDEVVRSLNVVESRK